MIILDDRVIVNSFPEKEGYRLVNDELGIYLKRWGT